MLIAEFIHVYLHSLLIFYRIKIAFNLCIAQRSGTASRAWHLLSINPLIGSCLARRNILQYFLSKFSRPGVCILFNYLQSLLDGSWKAEAKATRFTEFSNLRLGVYTPYAHENRNQSLNVYTSCRLPVRSFILIP